MFQIGQRECAKGSHLELRSPRRPAQHWAHESPALLEPPPFPRGWIFRSTAMQGSLLCPISNHQRTGGTGLLRGLVWNKHVGNLLFSDLGTSPPQLTALNLAF